MNANGQQKQSDRDAKEREESHGGDKKQAHQPSANEDDEEDEEDTEAMVEEEESEFSHFEDDEEFENYRQVSRNVINLCT